MRSATLIILVTLMLMANACLPTEPTARPTKQPTNRAANTEQQEKERRETEAAGRATVEARTAQPESDSAIQTRAAEAVASVTNSPPTKPPGTPEPERMTSTDQATKSQTPYTRIATLEDGEEPKGGEWYFLELDEESLYGRMIMMMTPGDRLVTTFGCITRKETGITEPIVKIRYPSRLPIELLTLEEGLEVQTKVNDNFLSLEWQKSLTQDTDIKLTAADAQRLVQHISATNANSYQIIFPHQPELNRIVPAAGLGAVVAETGTGCLTDEIKDQEVQPLMPPETPQEPRDGSYTYTSPNQRFTFQYPADCGQMWETATEADNFDTCTGNPEEINTSLGIINLKGVGEELSESPQWFTKDFADNIAERNEDATRYSLTTNAGHRLEVAEISTDYGYGPVTVVTAAFTDSQWHLIAINMLYWSDTSALNDERGRAALKTVAAKHP